MRCRDLWMSSPPDTHPHQKALLPPSGAFACVHKRYRLRPLGSGAAAWSAARPATDGSLPWWPSLNLSSPPSDLPTLVDYEGPVISAAPLEHYSAQAALLSEASLINAV